MISQSAETMTRYTNDINEFTKTGFRILSICLTYSQKIGNVFTISSLCCHVLREQPLRKYVL